MLKRNILCVTALAVLMLINGGCNSYRDGGDSADVIMEIQILDNPAVTAALDQMTGICTFTIEDWSVDVANEPKNSLATAPFNDIELINVTIDYAWFPATLTTPQRVVGLGHTVIPALSSSTVSFSPIAFDDLSIGLSGHTANLTLTFRAITIEGTPIIKQVFRQLNVEGCA